MFGRIARWLTKRAVAKKTAIDAERRAALRARPFPPEWYPFVAEIPQTYGLTGTQRDKLHGDVLVFIGEKEFVGEDDFVVDDRHRVIVATCASLLVVGRDIALFDHVRQVILRPDISKTVGGLYQQMQSKLGDEVVDTWSTVELSWRVVTESLVRPEGQHTVFHEFAHAFDDADGQLDALVTHAHYERWRTLLHELPLHHRIEGDFVLTEVIGDAEGPELFASASELFFECPRKLHSLDAALFDALVEIYALDPRTLTDR